MDFEYIKEIITSQQFLALTIVLFTLILFRFVADFIMHQAKKVMASSGFNCSEQIIDSFKTPLYFALIITGLYASTLMLVLPPEVSIFFDKLIKSLITITVFWALYNALSPCAFIFDNVSKAVGAKLSSDLKIFFITISKLILLFIGVMATLQIWGINVAAFIGGLGLVGIAVALAAQDTLKNLFGTVTIFFDNTFVKGDTIKMKDIEGKVELIGIRTTTIKDNELGYVIIPNSTIINEPIINYSRRAFRVVEWKICVQSATTYKKLDEIINEMTKWVEDSPLVEQDKKVAKNYILLNSFKDGMIEIECHFYSKSPDKIEYLRLKDAAMRAFKQMFEAHDISIIPPTYV